MLPLLPKGSLSIVSAKEIDKAFVDQLALENFGAVGGGSFNYIDKYRMWSGKLSFEGTKTVAMCRFAGLQDYMTKRNIFGVDPKARVRDMKEDSVKDFVATYPIWHGTIGVGGFLHAPAHFVFLERIMKEDHFGLKVAIVLPRDTLGMNIYQDESVESSTPAGHYSKHLVQMATQK